MVTTRFIIDFILQKSPQSDKIQLPLQLMVNMTLKCGVRSSASEARQTTGSALFVLRSMNFSQELQPSMIIFLKTQIKKSVTHSVV